MPRRCSFKLELDFPQPLAGVDEAGCAPLAGPVVAAACILNRDRFPRGIDDSKNLPLERREAIYAKAFARIETLVEHEPVLTVRIAPQQVADLERVLGTMTDGTRRVRVVPDASLSEEALVVETASGVVEAGIDTQLAALHAALVGNET